MARLFGTNGVRGIANVEITPELAARLGRALATTLDEGSVVAVGRDARTTGPMLEAAAVAGLLSAGAAVVRLGVVPTPAAQYYVKSHPGLGAGLVVTASHNPPEFNGLKLIASDGTEASRDEEERVEAAYFSQAFRATPWDAIRPIRDEAETNAQYVQAILRRVDAAAIRARRFRVVFDPGGGPGTLATTPLLRELGCHVETVFGDLDGEFKGRRSEPTEENLGRLIETVRRSGADIGIAHDGDADRCIFVDETGRWISGDVSLALLARRALQRTPGGVICTPVSTSSLLEEVVSGAGGRIAWTAVGAPTVAREMMRTGAVLGGEENGGVIFPDHQHCRDAAMTAAKLLEFLAAASEPMSRLVSALPVFHASKQKFPVPAGAKDHVLGRLLEWVRTETPRARIDTTDGLKVFLDRGWVLVRPSGTESIFRVFAESKDATWATAAADRFVAAGRRLAQAG